MGTMQRDKRIAKEMRGEARKKRHGIGKMGPRLYDLQQSIISEAVKRYWEQWENQVLYGDDGGAHLVGLG